MAQTAMSEALAAFHPTVTRWFSEVLGEPSAPQIEGWPAIRSGHHVLIAAPTGSGKTLAAFLWAIDRLLSRGADLADETQVLYVSPLKALANDVQKNLERPLADIRDRDTSLPEVRVVVRSGDTPAAQRTAMTRRPPHILVTTPESLYVLLTSDGGRSMLRTIRTVIVDEIHALHRDKRGSHLALSMERLQALVEAEPGAALQRIGLSATQKPLERIGRFLAGAGRDCTLVDTGHLRTLDLAVEIPRSPLSAVCSHEVWEEIYERMGELVREHRTTLVFVNTRKMAERIAARLTRVLGADVVSSHHGSLAKERRLDAEERLKAGRLKALVATASLELGIDIGDVDLVLQVGGTRSIATFLQRVGRAGHGKDRVPKGRLFPLTRDELCEAAALLRAVRQGDLDRTCAPAAPLDILAQQIVAACVPGAWDEEDLYRRLRAADPYSDLPREDFDAVVALHTSGRRALLHRDGVNGRLHATRRARLVAITSGGAIPDTADYQVVLEPEGTPVGSVHEDFAIESNAGDIFQLGNTSWRILRVQPGIVRVADAQGQPPTLPFWVAEAPGRTFELSAAISWLREECPEDVEEAVRWLAATTHVSEPAARQVAEYLAEGRTVLGAMPTQKRIVIERFFDESGGMQLVIHAPFGTRINRAWGLALRKRFCRSFGFELQAAANDEAIVLSLGVQHSFPIEEVFDYLAAPTARQVLVQALLASPMFETRFRWNASRALLLPRQNGGKRVPAPIQRMRATDLLAASFPQVVACGETLPPGDIPVPMDHPVVRQTVDDCLTEAMDVEGFLDVLRGLDDGTIARVAVDAPAPSAFAHGILNAAPYAFLDDAPLEERRTQAVLTRRALDARSADTIGELDPEAVRRVREEAWPSPENPEEVHEALMWMGYVTVDEGAPWQPWLGELQLAGRVVREGDRWLAVEASRNPVAMLRGRLEALGPIHSDDPDLRVLEAEGFVLRGRFDGRDGWCERRLLARIQRYTLERLRQEIQPVSAAELLRFLAAWQHVAENHRLEGPNGVRQVVAQLAGFEAPAAAWEASILPARVKGYRREWLDQLALSGEMAWGRLFGASSSAIRTCPIALVPRENLDAWLALAPRAEASSLPGNAAAIHEVLSARGALFTGELQRASRLLPAHLEMGLTELVSQGLVTCDSYGALRVFMVPASRRRAPAAPAGRWSLLGAGEAAAAPSELVARQLLARTGVVFRRTLAREKQPIFWRDLLRTLRTMEARGEVRGGRFVAGFDGEQYALPEAVTMLRALRRAGNAGPATVAAADPLNFQGILTPEERVSPTLGRRIQVG
ncbi:MAG: DEAD/DEAH box helicase [Acidobacteriota bacterium]